MPRPLFWFALLLLAPLTLAAQPSANPDPRVHPARASRGYVGAAVCGGCHAEALKQWQGSNHDHAMTLATPETVLGDFNNAELTAVGVTSRFFRRDGQFFVHTDGPDGVLRDYPIRYTFGWFPLQQYLIEFPGGRLQALGLAWDSRPAAQGGQRWFHLYPNGDAGSPVDHNHPLHWTAADQTWNYQCADCHSTDLQKRYDAEQRTYDTRYAEINVACEACHGPGAQHVGWARAAAGDPKAAAAATDASARGLLVDLKDRDGGVWTTDPVSGKPARLVPRAPVGGPHVQIETCARCHARRGRIWNDLAPDAPLSEGFRLALLQPALYYADGQIKDEVFEYGSFLQSRMFHQGVVCTDCHEPHSLKLLAEGNGLCVRCHAAARYDAPAHHHHAAGTPGAACVDCHMPQRLYMVVDARGDHSLRVPRPDLSVALGTPNACNGCHRDQDAAWAARQVAEWFPDPVNRPAHFATALHAADAGAADATARLLALAADHDQPAIARASALERLPAQTGDTALLTVQRLLADPQVLVRAQAVRALESQDLKTRIEQAWPLLSDPSRAVRLEAARVLAPVLTQGIGGALAKQMHQAIDELVQAELVTADRPEAYLNIGLLAVATGDAASAEGAYRNALALDERFTPARVNLADLYRATGQEEAAVAELNSGLALAGTDAERADLNYALGLALVRAKQLDTAIEHLATAARLAPANSRYAWVYAVALDGAGRTPEAITVLTQAQQQAPNDREVLVALVQFQAKQGETAAARGSLETLRRLAPEDPALGPLGQQIDGGDSGG